MPEGDPYGNLCLVPDSSTLIGVAPGPDAAVLHEEARDSRWASQPRDRSSPGITPRSAPPKDQG